MVEQVQAWRYSAYLLARVLLQRLQANRAVVVLSHVRVNRHQLVVRVPLEILPDEALAESLSLSTTSTSLQFLLYRLRLHPHFVAAVLLHVPLFSRAIQLLLLPRLNH